MSSECMSEQKEHLFMNRHDGHQCMCSVCCECRLVWLVGGLVVPQTFRVNDKWSCQRIVSAVPRHWRDVVSDACQNHAAHSSHKCVSIFQMIVILIFGIWVLLFISVDHLTCDPEICMLQQSLKMCKLFTKFHFELVLQKLCLTGIKQP